jgi:ATP-binding cassette subfamily A (ABC1) protein 3
VVQSVAGGFLQVREIADNASFVETVTREYRNLSLGGISVDLPTGNSLAAWEATSPGLVGPAMVNLVTNILFSRALNASSLAPNAIAATYQPFPFIDFKVFRAVRWATYFGAAMSVFPAFFALYVSRERRSSVQAMQLSNGLTNPVGLWLGHLLFDSVFVLIIATVVTVIFAVASDQFHGLGFFVSGGWFCIIRVSTDYRAV